MINQEEISSVQELTQEIAKEYIQRIINANDGVIPFADLHCSFTDERTGGGRKEYTFRYLIKKAFNLTEK